MQVIPAIDVLDGRAVRLLRGDFATPVVYGDPCEVFDALDVPAGCLVHVVDLAGSRDGHPTALDVVRRLARRDVWIQVGGGIRTLADAQAWLDAGAMRVVVGTVAANDPELLSSLASAIGPHRIVAAIDLRDGEIRTDGWKRASAATRGDTFRRLEAIGVEEILVTDISRDGALSGPSFALYRQLATETPLRVIASGGVTTESDVLSLARLPNVSGCVVGKALLERRFTVSDAQRRADMPAAIPERVIPCLDVRDGRVVKGVNFDSIRDAGDPVECATRYEAEGADEVVILDISATDRATSTAVETVRRVADALFIPLTVGGGVRTIDDFRAMLRAGADRVAINTAAVRQPELIREASAEFGVQAVVLSCDARRTAEGFEVMVRGGREPAGLDAVEWCRRAADLGAGEILLTSVDRDGTQKGFDIDLLRAVTAAVRINVIASGGAGTEEHFRDAIESGGARAVLAASLFHDRTMTIARLKEYLGTQGVPVRW